MSGGANPVRKYNLGASVSICMDAIFHPQDRPQVLWVTNLQARYQVFSKV